MKTYKDYIFLGINAYLLYGTLLVLFFLFRIFNILTLKEIFVISIILSGLLKYLLYRSEGQGFSFRKIIVTEMTYLAVFLATVAASSQIYDTTYDGRAYHQEAIIRLAEGYNPYYRQLDEDKEIHGLWINHYPKAVEIVSAALYAFTGNIETGKAFNLLFMISNVLIGTGLFLRWGKLSHRQGVLFAMILALNPVAVCQSLTYYVDGQKWSLLLAASYLMFLYLLEKRQVWNMMLALIIVSLANIKFTALVYLLMMIAVYDVVLLLTVSKKERVKGVVITGAAGLAAVFCIGFNPYVTNTLINGHPFYPIYGENKVDIITGNSPHEFKNKNRFEKFSLSFLGKSGNIMSWWSDEKIELKMPFTFDINEIKAMAGCDLRVAGFGPFFSGIFLVCMVLYFKDKMGKFKGSAGEKGTRVLPGRFSRMDMILFIVGVSVVVNPEFWWARYVPQLWAVPVLMLLSVGFSDKKLTFIPVLFYVITILMVSVVYVDSNIKDTLTLNRELALLSEADQKMVVYFENFQSDRLKLLKRGIAYTETKDDPGTDRIYENTLLGHGSVRHNDKALYEALKAISYL